ncbi:MAG: hypothetical protein PSV17_11120 [Methylotenera sp.]|uniref:hypothetical protein n=1 Tax=Methylotenera sp. TaxID=2051956 RepID=UPI00248A0EE4|nr:hypothetical protein [Methylotenera sp.]MDI1309965.1 hypothetical protein [Methylotenera sp.]
MNASLIFMLVSIGTLNLSGCNQSSPPRTSTENEVINKSPLDAQSAQLPNAPKEGETVMWRGNQLLVIKAVLGQRRLHTEPNLGYPIEQEGFIGQFPIDYVPKRFPKLSEKDAVAFDAAEEKRLKKYDYSGQKDIEFNLMLNGSTVIPTYDSPIASMKMDHPDQIKVFISRHHLNIADSNYKRSELARSYKRDLQMERNYDLDLMKGLDMNKKVSKAGVDCYEYIERPYQEGPMRQCFVHSDTPLAPDYHFYVPPEGLRNDIQVNRYAAGYRLYWYADQKQIYRAKEIDAAIWRLLDAWNVSPINALTLQDSPKN